MTDNEAIDKLTVMIKEENDEDKIELYSACINAFIIKKAFVKHKEQIHELNEKLDDYMSRTHAEWYRTNDQEYAYGCSSCGYKSSMKLAYCPSCNKRMMNNEEEETDGKDSTQTV